MKVTEELLVVTKAYDLILWSCNHTSRFPRSHRFVLGERIERNLYDLLETLLEAKYSRERVELLSAANLKLEILRFQVRLAKDLITSRNGVILAPRDESVDSTFWSAGTRSRFAIIRRNARRLAGLSARPLPPCGPIVWQVSEIPSLEINAPANKTPASSSGRGLRKT